MVAVSDRLGTYTKFGAAFPESGSASPDIFKVATLGKYALLAQAREFSPKQRVASCGRYLAPKQAYVSVRCDGSRATVRNLIRCSSVWACPVCSSAISEVRRGELKAACEFCKSNGLGIALLTLTLRHYKRHKLKDLLGVIDRAWQLLMRSRTGKKLKRMGLIGHIKARELTYGENGWHPHLHVLLVLDLGADLGAIAREIESKWMATIQQLGYGGNDHAVDVTAADSDIARYVSKFGEMGDWDVASEMSKSHVKRGRGAQSRTPFDLLRASLAGEAPGPLCALWNEYLDAFKGKRQLRWSPGLRDLLLSDLDEMSDEEIVEAGGVDMPEVARLTADQWRAVFRAGVGPFLVAVAECHGSREGIAQYLVSVGCLQLTTWVADLGPELRL